MIPLQLAISFLIIFQFVIMLCSFVCLRMCYININRIGFHWYSWANGCCISVIYMTLSCLADKVLSGPRQTDWVSWTVWTVQHHPGKQQTLKPLLNNCVSKCSIISKHDCCSIWLKMFTVAKLFSDSVVNIDPGAQNTMCLWEVNKSIWKKKTQNKQKSKTILTIILHQKQWIRTKP